MQFPSRALCFAALLVLPSFSHGQSVGYEPVIPDFGAQLQSGFYSGSGSFTGDVPDTAHSWSHLITSRHSNTGNNFQLQIAASYATNDRFFFRKIATGNNASNPAWNEVATRGSNVFSGTQTINGNINSNGFDSSTGIIYVKPQNGTNEGGHIQLRKPSTTYNDWNMDNYNGVLRFYMGGGTGSHYFYGNGNVYHPGNVGIGTTSPDYKLDVNGAIRAKEFFVETGWADFVFEDDYQLPSLGEVKKHIDEHGHLPGVPSAATIQKKGLEMGKAQTLMMQKIEELTLYVLQLSEENAELKSRMAEIEGRQIGN